MPVSKEFILAGSAVFTVEEPKGHHTYRVSKIEPTGRFPNPAWFVGLLTGPNNEEDYTYLGKLDDFTGEVVLTAKSRMTKDAYAFRLINRILARIWSDDHAAYEQHGFHTHHEGKCGRCGRALTVPESIESGFGPECIKHVSKKPKADDFNERWAEHKAEYAQHEAEQERQAFASDPDFVRSLHAEGVF